MISFCSRTLVNSGKQCLSLRMATQPVRAMSALQNLPTAIVCNESVDSRQFKGLILSCYQKTLQTDAPKLTPSGQLFDQQAEGSIVKLIEEAQLNGNVGEAKIFHNVSNEFDAVAVVGLGQKSAKYDDVECIEQNLKNVRLSAAVGANLLQRQNCTEIQVGGMDAPEQAAEGSLLAACNCQHNISEPQRKSSSRLKLYGPSGMNAWTTGVIRAGAQNLVRQLCDMPSNQLTPSVFGERASDLLCPCGVGVEIRDKDWIEINKMYGFLSVACTSSEPQRFLEISYRGGMSEDKPVLMIGDGMTFNTGGLCLKDPETLYEMRASMSGAAITVDTIRAAAQLRMPVNIIGLVPLCEDMTSGRAIKPSDIIRFCNGKTVRVDDSSNLGILPMADCLIYGQANHKPSLIMNITSFSSDIRQTFGEAVTPVFTNSNNVCKSLEQAGSYGGDSVWRMPLWKYFEEKVARCETAAVR